MRKLATIAALALGSAAHAAQTVLFNESAAYECYQAALHGGGSEFDIEPCTRALEHQAMNVVDRAATHSNRGLLYARSGDYAEAMRDHNRAVNLAPEIDSILINRSNTLVRLKRFEQAMQDLEQAIGFEGEARAHAHYNRALLFYRLGDRQSARMDAEMAAEIAPERPGYQRYLRMLELEQEVADSEAAEGVDLPTQESNVQDLNREPQVPSPDEP